MDGVGVYKVAHKLLFQKVSSFFYLTRAPDVQTEVRLFPPMSFSSPSFLWKPSYPDFPISFPSPEPSGISGSRRHRNSVTGREKKKGMDGEKQSSDDDDYGILEGPVNGPSSP